VSLNDAATRPTHDQSITLGRASLVDVFENFLGARIGAVTDHHFEMLASNQADELVAQIDIFLEAASRDEYPDERSRLMDLQA
jgi:hypothetical protein